MIALDRWWYIFFPLDNPKDVWALFESNKADLGFIEAGGIVCLRYVNRTALK